MGLIAASQLDTSAPEWLVDGLVPLNGIGFWHGPRSAAKSLVVDTELALAVGNGTQFFGRDVEQGNVVLCLGEGLYDAGIRKQARIDRQRADGGPEPYGDGHLLIWPEAFTVPVLRNRAGGVMGTPGFEAALFTFRQIPGLNLVILDALQDFSGGESITAQGPADRYVTGLRRMATELDCVVLVVAHDTKDGTGMLGSQRFEAAADFVIHQVPEVPLPGEPPNGSFVPTKQKYGPGCDATGFRIETGEFTAPVLGDDGEPSGETKTIPVATVRPYDPNELPPMPAAGRERRRRTGIRLWQPRKEEGDGAAESAGEHDD